MKKILILSVTAGDGHNSIGHAIKQRLLQNGYEVEFVDIFKYCNSKIRYRLIDKAYLFLCQHFVGFCNYMYAKLLNPQDLKWLKKAVIKNLNSLTPKIYNLILNYKPNAVVCTHVYGAILLSNLNQTFNLPVTTYGIVTDYSVHPFWEYALNLNYLMLPSNHLIKDVLIRGFKKEQIIITGIPTCNKFLLVSQPQNARKQLNLHPNVFTILIILGKARFKNVKKMITSMLEINLPLQIIIVNGKNKKFKKIINKLIKTKNIKNVLNLGYIDYIDVCLSASNIVISKAGATTLNETLNKNLPLFTYCELVQQEIDNVNYLVNNHASIKVKNLTHLCNIISSCITDNKLLEHLKQNIIKIKIPDASYNIVNLINQTSSNEILNLPKLKSKKIKKQVNFDFTQKNKH